MSWIPRTKRQSQIGSLCQIHREPQGPPAHELSLHCPCACAVETRSAHPRSCSFRIRRAITAAFVSPPFLPTCCAISASPLPRGSRELAVRGSSEFTASGRHLHTSSLCTSSSCMVILLPPVAEPALASALPRRRSPRGRPCQVIAVRGLVALRAGLPRAATLQLHPRTSALPAPRATTPPRALIRRPNA
jgi:hypothetical protein